MYECKMQKLLFLLTARFNFLPNSKNKLSKGITVTKLSKKMSRPFRIVAQGHQESEDEGTSAQRLGGGTRTTHTHQNNFTN